MKKFKNSTYEKTQNSNCDKTQKLKFVTKLKNLNQDKTKKKTKLKNSNFVKEKMNKFSNNIIKFNYYPHRLTPPPSRPNPHL